MDDIEPYGVYEGDDPYGEGGPGSVNGSSEDAGKISDNVDDRESTEALVLASSLDPRRFFEIGLLTTIVSHTGTELSTKYRESDSIPLTAVSDDRRRVSIHPLGIVEKPPGVSSSRWTQMDMDGLFAPIYEPAQIEELTGAEPEKEKAAPAVAESGGKGGRGETTGGEEKEHDRTEMPFLDHLEEFRWAMLKSIFAVVVGMIASWFMAENFITTMTRLAQKAEINLVYLKIMGPIMIRLQAALFMGIVISLPFVLYFIWSFVSPGLYKRERKWILPVVFSGTICFIIGASIAYFIIIPFMLKFIKGFMVSGVGDNIDISDFIGKMLKLTAILGLIFELPMLSYVLAKIGIIKHTWMAKYRKYAIVFIFIAGALITPPDPLSQVMMAIPLIMLYEISILVARIAGRKTLLG